MKKTLFLILFFAITAFSCNRIDAGHEGILVKLYGSNKGVQEATLVTGMVWYWPFTEDVIEYPIYYKTADYEPFTVNAKDGSIFDVDVMLTYRVKPTKSPEIFVKFRKDIDELQETILFTYTLDVFKGVFNKYTTDDILSKRSEIDTEVTKNLADKLIAEGFELGEFTFGMKYPESINEAIDSKNKATQQAQQKENELRMVKANAEIIITQAKAEAEANKLKQQTLTPLLIQQQFIEKWDGKTPIYGNSPAFFKNVN